ncbi:MAG: NAD+ synthase [Candidatus Scalindua sp. AMX11]|nr:MAG: NAD+ synthase [Candidatus Scalindua sp.]NOG85305.1 NAD+ synthase [Planctomycetota bacterium]RZV81478.1 MAG: NAD+ synthase [Candidatus Scalindua sp. SCAELEC01]TDE65449.1 MAG: NAD+ synthase [Candidatus Scalindua sp. AMX11]GJQ59373.1 MAG: NAD+ synthase [Candidatus Scalindua sp.]
MKISLAQINPTVGAFKQNVNKICKYIDIAKGKGADLVIFPEMSLVGYPPKDLLEISGFVDNNLRALEEVVSHVVGISAIVGFVDRNPAKRGKRLFNAAACIQDKKILSKHYKSLLPAYDVFDEIRYFEPSHLITIAKISGKRLGISICEDIWGGCVETPERIYDKNPLKEMFKQGVDTIINLSASPFTIGKQEIRLRLLTDSAKRYKVPFLYVNQVGGNDDLVFDGSSFVVNRQGIVVKRASSFKEDLITVEFKKADVTMENGSLPSTRKRSQTAIDHNEIDSVYKALILGTKDYVRKCGFKKVVIGLSGGIDSAVTAVIAAKALGKDRVLGITMPSTFSSKGSSEDSRILAERLGIEFTTIPITPIYKAYLKTLEGVFAGLPSDVTEENLQARIRGKILMAISNKQGYLVLTTGNKSELAVGYCTLYGDMCGGLAVISDIPKTMVYHLAEHINLRRELIPKNTIEKPASAELRPNQKDQDSLPPYDILDSILKAYVEESKDVQDIVKLGFDESLVSEIVKKVNRNEYKRKQAAPGLKVTSKAFGTGRRMPLAQRYRATK